MKIDPNTIDPTIPHFEFLGVIGSEVQTEGRIRMIYRWRITLPDLPPFLIEGSPKEWRLLLQEKLQYLQKQYPESFSQASRDEDQLFSDKFLQERLAKIEQIRQMALSGSLFD